MDTCCLCAKSRNFKDLSNVNDKKLEILKKLQETFNIELSNSSEKYCCRICIKKLYSSHSFYLQIIENQKKIEENVFEIQQVNVKAEKVEINAVCENIKLEKEEIIKDCFDESYDGHFNEDSGDFKDEIEEQSYQIQLRPKRVKTRPKTPEPPPKKPKSRKSRKKSIKGHKKTKKFIPITFLDSLKVIYKNENSGKFTDKFLSLNVSKSSILPDGRLSPAAESEYKHHKWTNYDWNCPKDCPEKFENIVELDEHLKKCHNTKFEKFCEKCGIKSCNYSSYITHLIKYHNSDSRFSCIICSVIFNDLKDLYHHCKTHYPKRILMCLYCGYHFNISQFLKNHLVHNHKHVDNRDIYSCDQCDFQTKSKQILGGHMFNHLTSSKEICDQCGAEYKRRGALESHKKFAHAKRDEIYSCEICGKNFKTLLYVRKHRKAVHQKHMYAHNYECKVCKKKFRTNYQLKVHMYSHDQNSSRYKCPHCDKAFRYTSGFQYHIRSAHTNEKPYGCPCCDFTFFDYANATKHVKASHGGDFKPIRVG